MNFPGLCDGNIDTLQFTPRDVPLTSIGVADQSTTEMNFRFIEIGPKLTNWLGTHWPIPIKPISETKKGSAAFHRLI